MKVRIFIFSILLVFFSCKKEEPQAAPPVVSEKSVFVANEGNYQFGNASLSLYNPAEKGIQNEVFKNANNRPLGDVFQSITGWKGKLYLVVNNSGKIEVVDANTLKAEREMSGFTSPRYLCFVNESKAYVSDLYANSVQVIDPNSGQITKSIACKGWTEKMLYRGNYVYVSNLHSASLYRIDIQTDQIKDSVNIGFGSNSLAEDKNGKLWLSCLGNKDLGIPASVSLVDPENMVLEKKINLPQEASRLCINPGGDVLYFIMQQSVVAMPIGSDKYDASMVFIPSQGRNLYGLAADAGTGDVYVSDAKDYTQKGQVFRYSATGQLIHEFRVGYIPSGFHFSNK